MSIRPWFEAGNECNAVLTPATQDPPPTKWQLPPEKFFAQVLPKLNPPAGPLHSIPLSLNLTV